MEIKNIEQIIDEEQAKVRVGFKIIYTDNEKDKIKSIIRYFGNKNNELKFLNNYINDIFRKNDYLTLFSYRVYFGTEGSNDYDVIKNANNSFINNEGSVNKENKQKYKDNKKYLMIIAHGFNKKDDQKIYNKTLKSIEKYIIKKYI